MKRISLKVSEGNETTVVGERIDFLSNVISTTVARRLMRKGCEAYLAHVVDTRQAKPNLCDIPTVRDFPDVFCEAYLAHVVDTRQAKPDLCDIPTVRDFPEVF